MDISSLIDSLKQEITSVKDQLSNISIGETLRNQLLQNKTKLEQWYDTVLKKGGLISDEEVIGANDAIIQSKKAELEQSAKKTKIIIGAIILGSIITAGIVIYMKHRKA